MSRNFGLIPTLRLIDPDRSSRISINSIPNLQSRSTRHSNNKIKIILATFLSLKDKGFLKGNKESLKIFKDFLNPGHGQPEVR